MRGPCPWCPSTPATTPPTSGDWYTTLAKEHWLTFAAGDWNSYRQADGPADWDTVKDRAFYVNRTYLADDGSRRTDDRPDRILTAAGYIDVGQWAAEHLGQADALLPTAGFGPEKARQGGPSAVDRPYLSEELAFAVKHASIVDTPQTREWSDHLPGVVVLRRNVLHTAMNRAVA